MTFLIEAQPSGAEQVPLRKNFCSGNAEKILNYLTENHMSRRHNHLKSTILCFFVLLAFHYILPSNVLAETVLNPSLSRKLNISNTGESWTDDWHVLETETSFPGGGKAGFYRRATMAGEANPHSGRNGVLYLLPESRYRPARIVRKDITLPKESASLKIGVAANRNPRGEWGLTVKISDRQVGEEIIINGSKGWQDLSFDLSSFANQRVDIVIEAGATNRNNGYVFIDYINVDTDQKPTIPALDSSTGQTSGHSAETDKKVGSFDPPYQKFLEMQKLREEERSRKIQDQIYQDNQSEMMKLPEEERRRIIQDQIYRDQQTDQNDR